MNKELMNEKFASAAAVYPNATQLDRWAWKDWFAKGWNAAEKVTRAERVQAEMAKRGATLGGVTWGPEASKLNSEQIEDAKLTMLESFLFGKTTPLLDLVEVCRKMHPHYDTLHRDTKTSIRADARSWAKIFGVEFLDD